jgi:hypothetical protein
MLEGKKIGPDWACKNGDCKKGVFRDGSFDYNQAVGAPPVSQAPPDMELGQAPPPEDNDSMF